MDVATIPTQDDADFATHESLVSTPKRLMLVVAIFSVGMAFFAWSPIWLTPPHFAKTTAIYLVLLVIWVLFLGLLGRKSKYAFGIFLLGLVFNCSWAMAFSQQSLTIQFLFPFPVNCTQETDNHDQVRYTCVRSGSGVYTEYHFSGQDGLPFMWRDSIRSSSDTADR